MFCGPRAVPVTFTENMQDAPAASVAPARDMVPDPAVAVMVPPPHVPLRPLGVVTTKPAGKVSVKPIPLCEVAFEFITVNVRLVVPPITTLGAPNTLVTLGGAITVSIAIAVFPVPAIVSVTVTLLVTVPGAVPVTLTENVQDPLAAIVPPESDMVPLPAVAVMVPAPHMPLRPLGVATSTPAGSVSVKATAVRGAAAFGLEIMNVRVVVPFSMIVEGENAFVMDGGNSTGGAATTVTSAHEVAPGPERGAVAVTQLC